MPIVGATEPFSGNVTTLNWIAAFPKRRVEENLGYGAGRLSDGYFILLLKQKLEPQDFIFEGTTLRSGGKLGLPGATRAEDDKRQKVHDQILAERGVAGYLALQRAALVGIRLEGHERIAKVLPTTGHDDAMAPSAQYPMGGGGLQWRLVRKCAFLVAAYVDADDTAFTRDDVISLKEGGADAYDRRARLARFLAKA